MKVKISSDGDVQARQQNRSVYVFPAAVADYQSGRFYSDTEEEGIEDFKRKNDIDIDQVKVVDDIQDGYDSLENYQGPTRELLEMEISRRDLPITQDRIYGVQEQFQIQST